MTVPLTSRSNGRPKRRRLGVRHLGYFCLLSIAGVCLLAVVQVSRLFADGSNFRLTSLEVVGLRLLRGSDILEASGLAVGADVFAVDLHQISDRVEELAWVKQAVVMRKPPNRLVVTVQERTRVAWLESGAYYGVDQDGVLLPPRQDGEGHSDLNLPVIRGIDGLSDSLAVGTVIKALELRRLLGWWRQANEADAEFCLNVSEIEAIGPNSRPPEENTDLDWRTGGIRLHLIGDGLEVRLPWHPVGEKLQILKGVMARLYKDRQDPAYVDLRYAGQVVVGNSQAPS